MGQNPLRIHNLGVSGNLSGTGVGNRATGPDGKPYIQDMDDQGFTIGSTSKTATSLVTIVTKSSDDSGLDLYDHGDTTNSIVELKGTASADGEIKVNSTDGAVSCRLFNESSKGAFGGYSADGNKQLVYAGTDTYGGVTKVTDTDGNLSAKVSNQSDKQGQVEIYTPSGQTGIAGLGADTHGGKILASASDGTTGALMSIDSSKRGALGAYNAAGDKLQATIKAGSNGGVIEASDPGATGKAILEIEQIGSKYAGSLSTKNTAGTLSAKLATDANDYGITTVCGPTASKVMSSLSGSSAGGEVKINAADETLSAKLFNESSKGAFAAYSADGSDQLNYVGTDSNGGLSKTADTDGNKSFEAGSDGNKRGFSKLYNPAGDSARVHFSVDSSDMGKGEILASDGTASITFKSDSSKNAVIEATNSAGEKQFNLDTNASNTSYLNANKLLLGSKTAKGNANLEVGYKNSVISASYSNIYSTGSVIVAGSGHTVSGDFDIIAGGTENNISGGNFSFVGGGSGVGITGSNYSSSVGGENNNLLTSDYSFIGGGQNIDISGSNYAVSVGGENNDITGSSYATIGGGVNNLIDHSTQSFIGGGGQNAIRSGAAGAALIGGAFNRVLNRSSYSAIGGGRANEVSGLYGFIGGGISNIVSGEASTILGGRSNEAEGKYCSVVGGLSNIISGNPVAQAQGLPGRPTGSVIVGGVYNYLTGGFSTILGGSGSRVEAEYSFVLGRTGIIPRQHTGASIFTDGHPRVTNSSGAHTALFDFASGVYIANTNSEGTILTIGGGVAGTGAGGRITLGSLPYLLSGDVVGEEDTNSFVTGADFNTSNGELSLIRNSSLSTITVDLDGRFKTGINSSDVTSALGYTPVDPSTTGALVNDNDISSFITGINSSNVTDALGYTPVNPSTTGALVNDNDIANFISGVSASDVTGALGFNPITGVSSSDVTDALGYTPVNPSTTGALVNDNDIANFISGVSASDVTGALGFNPITGVSSSAVTSALGYTPVDPSTTGALVNDNDIANFISGVSASDVTGALGFNPITGVSSSDVTDALGYVPVNPSTTGALVNDNDIANFITGINATDVTGALGFNPITGVSSSDVTSALGYTPVDPSTTGALVNDNDIANFISGVSASDVTGALGFNPITGVSSSDVTSALGYTPVDPSTTGALLNDNDIADFITGINSSNVTSALGYTPVDPSTTGALVNDNDISSFITGINSSNVTDALGYTPVNPGSSPTFNSIYLQNTIFHDGDTDTRIDVSADTIQLATAGTTALTVASNSNVGIGTASPNAAHKVHVEGISYARSGVFGPTLVGQSPPAEGLIVAGNVGIGTYSATNKLGVYGSANVGASYQSTAAPSNGLIVQGNVGIATSSPASALDVSGAIKGAVDVIAQKGQVDLDNSHNGSFINSVTGSVATITIGKDLMDGFNVGVVSTGNTNVVVTGDNSMFINGISEGKVTLASGYQPGTILRLEANKYVVFGNIV